MLDAQMIADVRHVAARVSGLLGSPIYGRDDVAQSILLRIVERTPRFDPRLASARTWARLIARHEAASMIAQARAEKRDCRVCTRSLNERVTTISSDIYRMRTGRQTRPASELQFLAIDLEGVLDKLPPNLGAVARLLAEGETPAEAATILNISRATIYRRIVRIRTVFRDAGFESYAGLQEAA
jgi:RNA polymerase sigma factor (sigma-70 family)